MSTVFRKPKDGERNSKATIYLGNLDPQVNEPLLYELLVQFAPIKSLNLPKDRVLRTHQGFGFAEFRTVKDAEYTLDILRGVRLFGKSLKMNKAEPFKGAGPEGITGGAGRPPTADIGAKLFVSNLSELADEQYLQETFSKFGNVVPPTVVMRDDNGVSKGYGFVTFDDFESSDTAIQKLDGLLLMNMKVSVSYAYKEDPSQRKVRHGDRVERLLAENAKTNAKKEKESGRRPRRDAGRVLKPRKGHGNR